MGQKWWTGRGTGQLAKVSVNRFPLPNRGLVEKCKKHYFSSSSLSFSVEGSFFLIEVRSRVTVTYQTLNAPTASELIDPQLDRSRLFFVFFLLSRLETYKSRVPLYLWVREHLHLFVYLLVLAIKALILFLVHQIFIFIFFSAPLWFILAF